MINLPLKVLIGVGVAGAIGGGGYGIYIVSKPPETIFEALTRKNFSFFNADGTADDGDWDKKVEAYKSKKQTDPTLDGYTEKTDGSTEEQKSANRNSMKKACGDLVKKPAKDVSKLDQAKKWCTKTA